MKTFYGFRIKKAIAFFLLLISFGVNSSAQTPQYYYSNALSPTNSFPFNIALGKEIQLLYLPGDFAQPSPAPAGNIASVSFIMAATLGPFTYTDVEIKMGQATITAFDAGVWYTGPLTSVYSRSSVVLSASAGSWLTIELDNTFPYDPTKSLIIDVKQCGAPGATGFCSATTANSGFRRNTSLVGQSCPLPWGQQSGTLNNVGFSFGSTPSCNYSWAAQNSGTTTSLRVIKAVNDQVVWAGGTNGVIRRTTDGGSTWTDGNPNPGVINGIIYAIAAVDATTAVCSTSPSDAFVYKTTNGGANWTQVWTQTGGFINAIEYLSPTTAIMEGDPVGGRWSLWKSTDAGSTWDSTGLYQPQAGTEAGWVSSMSVVGTNIWFGTNNTSAYRSTNSGANWTSAATTGLLNSYSIHFNSPTLGMAGGTSIAKSTDGGLNYVAGGTVPGSGNMNAIEGKDNNFWVIRGTGIYRSTDAGDSWALEYTVSGTGNDLSFAESGGCLVGWSVTTTGQIAKMSGTPVGISNNSIDIPETYELGQNYPNPFNPSTKISYSIPRSGFVELKVFDVLGKEIASLVNDYKQAGSYIIDFNASSLTSGVYFYKISAGEFYEIRKMILVK